jgi:acyl carrier protein
MDDIQLIKEKIREKIATTFGSSITDKLRDLRDDDDLRQFLTSAGLTSLNSFMLLNSLGAEFQLEFDGIDDAASNLIDHFDSLNTLADCIRNNSSLYS